MRQFCGFFYILMHNEKIYIIPNITCFVAEQGGQQKSASCFCLFSVKSSVHALQLYCFDNTFVSFFLFEEHFIFIF